MKKSILFIAIIPLFVLSFAACKQGQTDEVTDEVTTDNSPKLRVATPFTDTVFIDPRDKKTYPLAKIGEQIWMTKNMEIELDSSWSYDDNAANATVFGRLYTHSAAGKACPKGWHLPTQEEWFELFSNFDQDTTDNFEYAAYEMLIQDGKSEFNALLAGIRSTKEGFYDFRNEGFYWSSTPAGTFSPNAGHYFYVWFYSEEEMDKCLGKKLILFRLMAVFIHQVMGFPVVVFEIKE